MIIAVDFDGTLCENRWPNIGAPNKMLIQRLIELRRQGHKVILWTMRTDKPMEIQGETRKLLFEAVDFCEQQGLIFDSVNEPDEDNAKRFGNDSRKIYADIYIDDHNVSSDFMVRFGIPYTRQVMMMEE